MSKFTETNKKIEEGVVSGYKKIEEGVVGGYKKIEEGVVTGFNKVSDKFVDKFLAKDGETVEDAKARMKDEQSIREEKSRQDMEARKAASEDIVKKNLEASLNAGKKF